MNEKHLSRKTKDWMLKGYASLRIPTIDQEKTITHMMSAESNQDSCFLLSLLHCPIIIRFAYVSVACLVIITFISFLFISFHQNGPVRQISLDTTEDSISILWKIRLQMGRFVTTPLKTVTTIIKTKDESIIICEPQTQLALKYGKYRTIQLRSGSATIHASHKPEHPMIVETPKGTISVVGTIFRVEIHRSFE